jgi:hypothetical protein
MSAIAALNGTLTLSSCLHLDIARPKKALGRPRLENQPETPDDVIQLIR